MKFRLLALAALMAAASPAFAVVDAASHEALVDTTATKVTSSFLGRTATFVQNKGPNPIFCQLHTATGLTSGKGTVIAVGGSWSVPGAADVYCLSSALQLTGAATIVTETSQGSSFAMTPAASAAGGVPSENVAQINGVTPSMGNGVSGTGVQRVTLASDGTGQVALAAGAATIGALTANQTVDMAKVGGNSTNTGNGVSGIGVQRVTIASDSTGQVALAAGSATIGALTANQTVDIAKMNGVATTMGNGASGTGVQRVTIASDSTGQVALAAGAATIGALTANQTVDVAKMNGVATSMGNGVSGTGVQRVTLASDGTGQVVLAAGAATIGALTANQSVNISQMNGVTTTMGNGASGTGVQRVTLASDSTGQVTLAAGAATIGALTANQSVNISQMNGVTTTMGNGVSGTGVQRVTIASDSTGQIIAVGAAADGAAVSGNPIRVAGKDGSGNTQDLLSDTSGLLRTEGSAAAGAASGGTWAAPTLVSCTNSTVSSATLVAGQVYEMTADIDMFIRPAATATTSWRPIWGKTYLYGRQVATGGSAGVIACITASGSGTLYLTPITTAE